MKRTCVLAVMVAVMGVAAWSQGRDDTLVLQGGTLIDGTGATPVADAVVVIQGNRILAAGPRSTVRVPPGAKISSTAGKFIIPGLIDAHVHYDDWVGELFLAHGVTSVVELGNFSDYMVALADSIEKGWDVGPRIFAAGEFFHGPEVDMGYLQAQVFLTDAEQARAKVRELARKGMNVIKAMQDLSKEQLTAVVDEAHKLGLPVTGHSRDAWQTIAAGQDAVTHESSVISGAIKNPDRLKAYRQTRVHCPASLMDSEGMDGLAADMVKRKVYYNPTFVSRYKTFSQHATEQKIANVRLFARNELQYVPLDVREGIISTYDRLRNEVRSGKLREPGFTWLDELKPEEIEEYRQCYARSLEFVRRFVSAGGKVNTGTDTWNTSVPGAGLLHEMEILTEAGMTPMQVLQATTINTAQFLRMEKTLGTVEAGKLADIVVLDADPLADISNVQKIASVIKGGKIVDRQFHREYDPIIKRPMDNIIRRLPVIYRGSPFFRGAVVMDITPGLTTEGSADVEIVIDGLGFSGTSVVRIATSKLRTIYDGPEQLRATIPARLLQVPGTYPVTVENPPPGGGVSNPYGFIVKFR